MHEGPVPGRVPRRLHIPQASGLVEPSVDDRSKSIGADARPLPSPITVVRPDSVPSAGGSGPAGGGPAAGVSFCPSCRGATGMDQTFLEARVIESELNAITPKG